MYKVDGNIKCAPNKTTRDGELIGVIGAQGSGKSLTMTYCGLTNLLKGDEIYSNYHLYGNFKYNYMNEKTDLFTQTEAIFNSTLLIDEFHSYLDAYDWKDKKVIEYVKQKMVTARRNGNYYIMGNQLKGQFPLRLRSIIPRWLLPEITRKGVRNGRVIPTILSVLEINRSENKIKRWKFRADNIINYYNTYENFDHLLLKDESNKNELKDLAKTILEEEFDGGN